MMDLEVGTYRTIKCTRYYSCLSPSHCISSALITIDGSGDIFGEPPKILVNSVDGDNGASTTDFVTQERCCNTRHI